MAEPAESNDSTNREKKHDRQPWIPLTFQRVDVADAQLGFTGTGMDNTFYS